MQIKQRKLLPKQTTGYLSNVLKRTLVEYDKIIRKAGGSITVTTWLDKYLKIQQERVEQKEISHHIVKQRQAPINAMRQVLGIKPIADVTTRDIVDLIDEYKVRGHTRMAPV